MSLNAKLVVVGGDVKTTEIKLRLPSTIGRGKGTTIVLQHPLVSRQHCELFESGGQLMVRDLGSLNGTFVNNQRVTESPLPAGELLTVGTVTFRAIYDSDAAAAAAPGKAALAATKVDAKRASSAPTLKPKPAVAATEVEEVEFDFDKPLLAGDDDLIGETAHPTEALEADAQRAKSSDHPTRGRIAAMPPASKPSPGKPDKPTPLAATKTDDATVDFSSLDDDDEAAASSDSDDDDLNDFLKNLGDK